MDPYSRVVSDVYQDLFAEGSFIGKGIYEVDSFEKRCTDFPENQILSHDLLESCYCRSALLTDVVLYEDYPSRYTADVSRRHRWMRGDWQIAAWLMPRVPSLSGRMVSNPISLLSRWKIFDNLRRSLMPICLVALLLIAWLGGTAALAGLATGFVITAISLPTILSLLLSIAAKPSDLPLRIHLSTVMGTSGRPLVQCLLTLIFLPFEAFVSLDAIVRTLTRLYWTKQTLLEWKTSSDSDLSARSDLHGLSAR